MKTSLVGNNLKFNLVDGTTVTKLIIDDSAEEYLDGATKSRVKILITASGIIELQWISTIKLHTILLNLSKFKFKRYGCELSSYGGGLRVVFREGEFPFN